MSQVAVNVAVVLVLAVLVFTAVYSNAILNTEHSDTVYVLQPYGAVADLTVNHSLRILQLADTQIQDIHTDTCRNVVPSPYPCDYTNTTRFIQQLVALLGPDVVVFTGDQLSRPRNAQEVIDVLLDAVHPVPFVWVNGNHDADPGSEWSPTQIREYVAPRAVLHGTGLVKVNNAAGERVLDLYAFDYEYADAPPDTTWLPYRKEHIAWFAAQPSDGTPGLVFGHVPVREFRFVDDVTMVGSRLDGWGYSTINNGMFAAIKAKGNIVAMSVGHDHVNDFCFEHEGVDLCYAGGIGFTTYGREGFRRRARVFDAYPNGTVVTSKYLDNLERIDVQWL